ncbi:MAG: DUF2721 domain-containing protein, partial [Allomuricauda sp.]
MEELTKNFIGNLGTPVLVALCAMAALISLRNIHLSDRARQIFDKYDKGNGKDTSLKSQATTFINRYKKTSWAFISIIGVLITTIIIKIIAKPNLFTSILVVICSILFVISIIFMGLEFGKGHKTLEDEW